MQTLDIGRPPTNPLGLPFAPADGCRKAARETKVEQGKLDL